MRIYVLVGILGTATMPAVRGQVNIEALRSEKADSGLAGALGLNLSLRTGNVDLLELGVDGRIDYVTTNSLTLFLWNGDLGFIGGNRFTNDGLLHLRHGRPIRGPTTVEAFGQINYDKSRLLDFRALLGGGLRLGIVDTRHAGLWLGVGCMYEHEVLGLPVEATHARRTDVYRASNYLAARVAAGPRLVVAATGYAQPQVDELRDIRIVSDAGLGVTVTKTVSLAVRFKLRYDSRPPDGTAGLDTEMRNGLTIAF